MKLPAFLIAVVVSCPTFAQSNTGVLKGSEITESALVEALAPPETVPEGVRTRSLKLGNAQGGRSANIAQRSNGAPRSKDVLITFESNSMQLNEDGKASLDVVARAFNSERLVALSFMIEGHADPRGSAQDNLRLSQARANTVRNYLVAMKGVRADRLTAIGKGDAELLNPRNPTAPENRRVTFVTNQ
jgi:OmpA-OmpF porin, OOP family